MLRSATTINVSIRNSACGTNSRAANGATSCKRMKTSLCVNCKKLHTFVRSCSPLPSSLVHIEDYLSLSNISNSPLIMDAQHEAYAATLNVNHFKPQDVPWRRLGQCEWYDRPVQSYAQFQHRPAILTVGLTLPLHTPDFWRPIEDGSNTQYRLAVIESLIPPKSDGPIVHFHEMHDEGFFVTVSNHSLISDDTNAHASLVLTDRFPNQERQGTLPRPRTADC